MFGRQTSSTWPTKRPLSLPDWRDLIRDAVWPKSAYDLHHQQSLHVPPTPRALLVMHMSERQKCDECRKCQANTCKFPRSILPAKPMCYTNAGTSHLQKHYSYRSLSCSVLAPSKCSCRASQLTCGVANCVDDCEDAARRKNRRGRRSADYRGLRWCFFAGRDDAGAIGNGKGRGAQQVGRVAAVPRRSYGGPPAATSGRCLRYQ